MTIQRSVQQQKQQNLEICCRTLQDQNLNAHHVFIMLTGILCKKIPCIVRDSNRGWGIAENTKIFQSYAKYF